MRYSNPSLKSDFLPLWELTLFDLWPSAPCSTAAASGWGCTSTLTWEVRWWSWPATAPASWTASTTPTSTPAPWWTDTGSCTSSPTTGGATSTWSPDSTRASATGAGTTLAWAPSNGSWTSKDGRPVLVKCLLFALFHTLNKMASVLKCFQFCSCSLRLEGTFSIEDVSGWWPDVLTLFRGLNKILRVLTLIRLRLKSYLLYSWRRRLTVLFHTQMKQLSFFAELQCKLSLVASVLELLNPWLYINMVDMPWPPTVVQKWHQNTAHIPPWFCVLDQRPVIQHLPLAKTHNTFC